MSKATVAASGIYWGYDASGQVEPTGMTGADPVLGRALLVLTIGFPIQWGRGKGTGDQY